MSGGYMTAGEWDKYRAHRMPKSETEWYVRDANGNVQGPWPEAACREDVASGKGGVQVLCRRVTELMEVQ